jgi:hypothetical protein
MLTMIVIYMTKRLGTTTIGTAEHQSEVDGETIEVWVVGILLQNHQEEQLEPGADPGAVKPRTGGP